MKHLATAILYVLVVSCAATNYDRKIELSRIEMNEKLWSAQHQESYIMTYKRGCFCLGEEAQKVKVYVLEGKIVDVRVIVRPYNQLDPEVVARFITVDQLFGLIRQLLEDRVAELSVVYDIEKGFPVLVQGDVSEELIDNEFTYQIFDISPYEAPPELGQSNSQLRFNELEFDDDGIKNGLRE